MVGNLGVYVSECLKTRMSLCFFLIIHFKSNPIQGFGAQYDIMYIFGYLTLLQY